MLQGTGNKERSSGQQNEHSSRDEEEIKEIAEKLQIHEITSFKMGAGARIELAAPEDETGMLPLHHPAESKHAFQRLEQEAAKGIGKASDNAVFEFVKGIERHSRPHILKV